MCLLGCSCCLEIKTGLTGPQQGSYWWVWRDKTDNPTPVPVVGQGKLVTSQPKQPLETYRGSSIDQWIYRNLCKAIGWLDGFLLTCGFRVNICSKPCHSYRTILAFMHSIIILQYWKSCFPVLCSLQWQVALFHHACCVCPKPFIFLFDTAQFVPGPLQFCLQALNANHSLQQVLVKIVVLFLQHPEHRGMMGDGVTSQNIFILEIT